MKSFDVLVLITYIWLFIKAISGYVINLTPKNGEYCTGGNITMTCTIIGAPEKWRDPANDLIFKYNNELVESSLVTVINGKTAQYFITNKVPEDIFFCVECCYKKCPSKFDSNKAYVFSFVQPVEVQNLTCVVHGIFSGSIRCTWDYGVDYTKSWNKPVVYFIWRNSSIFEWTYEKLDSVANNSKDFPDSTKVNYLTAEVGVNITSSHCPSKAVYKNFYSIKTVQLPAVGNLTAVPLKNRCSEISWLPTSIDHIFKESYSIHCTNKWNVPMNTDFISEGQTSVKLCHMIPNTTYTCTVKVKLLTEPDVPWSDAIWSEGRNATVHTLDDIPDESPAVTNGAFMWENQHCSSKHTMAPVWIYWRPIEPRYQNGRPNGTLLTYGISTGEMKTIANVSSHTARLLLVCDQWQTVLLQSVNNKGHSTAISELRVSPLDQDVIELIVEVDHIKNVVKNTTVMSLEWEYSEHNQVNSFTVFYAAKSGVTCFSESLGLVKWKNVSGTKNKTEITISDRPHCYGLSVQTGNRSSGLRWTDCVYAKNEVPKPPSEVNVTDRGDNSVVVRWSKTQCSTNQPYINWYQIKYCPVTPNGTCAPDDIISCSGRTSYLILYHLDTGTEYHISLRAVTRFNVTGKWSDVVSVSTTDRSTRVETEKVTNIIEILLPVPSIVILSVIIFCTRRKIMKHVKSGRGVENIPVYPDSPSDSNGNGKIPGQCSSGSYTYLDTNEFTGTQDNPGFLADNDHKSTGGDEQETSTNRFTTFDKNGYLMLTGSRHNANEDANTSVAAGVNTYESVDADVCVTTEKGELDPEQGEHSTSDMDSEAITLARAEHDSAQRNHNKLVENLTDTDMKVDAMATAEHNFEQRDQEPGENKHASNATDLDENGGQVGCSVLTEPDTAERITKGDGIMAPATLNTAKKDKVEPPDIESVLLQPDTDIKDSLAKNTLTVKNADEQFSKVSDSIEMGLKTTVACQENNFRSSSDDSEIETRHAEEHKNNCNMDYVDHLALKVVQPLKSTAETESKEMENKSREKEDTEKFCLEKSSESVVFDNETDDKGSKSHSVQEYVTSEQMANIIIDDMQTNVNIPFSYQMRNGYVVHL